MNKCVSVVLYPVSDLNAAKALFKQLLGVGPMADDPYYVGFQLADQHIGLDPNGAKRGMTGATPFWEVDEIKRAGTRPHYSWMLIGVPRGVHSNTR